ncbi:hypothetical protein CHO01_08610 [Cellulomonas hominis]|uniref:Uncharacterized protein n=1 Tax=Cellulomonas hominis TaxID=156981 RepID=A0A511F964_9CELL|nr:hypothetical protein CHO01_08610 [Cellulomonas hominis]
MAGTTYRNTAASPYTAIVGAGRRLATELVVISASATQEIQAEAGTGVRRGAASAGGLSGVPASTGGAGASRRCRGAAAPVVGVSLVADMAPPVCCGPCGRCAPR